jgi:hypothetical protein
MNTGSTDTPLPARRVEAFAQALAKEMLTFCGPIFITPGLLTYPEQMIDNGTYSLIDTGRRRLLVTCHHVWQAYCDCRAENPDAVLGLNLGEGDRNIAFAFPERQLIDADPDLDLAVFDFEPSQIQVKGVQVNHQKDWFPIRKWPIPKASDGDCVVLMGFPGKRIKKARQLCIFTTQIIPLKISGVGHKGILILNEPKNVEVFADIKNRLGGLSGSPAYTLSKNGASLVGFVKAGYKRADCASPRTGSDSLFAGSLSLTHACFLQPDGKLVRSQ